MKLIHISDIHIHTGDILGLDPVANFTACLNHVEEFHPDADRIVITGDLAHKGLVESYERLKAMLDLSIFKGDQAPRLLIGNHDNRPNFRAVFPQTAADADGYVQWSEDTPAGRFIYLDTMQHGTDAGHYGPDRRAWLTRELEAAKADGVKAWLFMHHNPIAVQVANADAIGFVEEAEIQALLAAFRDTVAHIFFGHCHYTLSGVVRGIPYSAPRSTNHTCWPDFSGIVDRMGYGELQPNYNVCFLEDEGTVIHSIDFLDEHKVRWRLE